MRSQPPFGRKARGPVYATPPRFPFKWTPLKMHYRVLDLERDDIDDFFKIDVQVSPDPAFTDYISPTEAQRWKNRHAANLRARAIVKQIDLYKQNAAWRKRLRRVAHELEFVFEPYHKKAVKKWGGNWRWLASSERFTRTQNYSFARTTARRRALLLTSPFVYAKGADRFVVVRKMRREWKAAVLDLVPDQMERFYTRLTADARPPDPFQMAPSELKRRYLLEPNGVRRFFFVRHPTIPGMYTVKRLAHTPPFPRFSIAANL